MPDDSPDKAPPERKPGSGPLTSDHLKRLASNHYDQLLALAEQWAAELKTGPSMTLSGAGPDGAASAAGEGDASPGA